jgi:hypothetical protein
MEQRALAVHGFDLVKHTAEEPTHFGELRRRLHDLLVRRRHSQRPDRDVRSENRGDAISCDRRAKCENECWCPVRRRRPPDLDLRCSRSLRRPPPRRGRLAVELVDLGPHDVAEERSGTSNPGARRPSGALDDAALHAPEPVRAERRYSVAGPATRAVNPWRNTGDGKDRGGKSKQQNDLVGWETGIRTRYRGPERSEAASVMLGGVGFVRKFARMFWSSPVRDGLLVRSLSSFCQEA